MLGGRQPRYCSGRCAAASYGVSAAQADVMEAKQAQSHLTQLCLAFPVQPDTAADEGKCIGIS